MNLGQMHSGAAGVLANVMALIEAATNEMAVDSLTINKEMVKALKAANEMQADYIQSSEENQADQFKTDAMGQMISTVGLLAPMAIQGYHSFMEKGVSNATEELKTAQSYKDGLLTENFDGPYLAHAPADAPNYGARINNLKTVRNFSSKELLDSEMVEDRQAFRAASQEEQGEILRRLDKAIDDSTAKLREAQGRVNTHIQLATSVTNSIQSLTSGAFTTHKASLQEEKAKLDAFKTLTDYLTQVYQQLMQVSLSVANQQRDAVAQLLQAQTTIAQLNRAV